VGFGHLLAVGITAGTAVAFPLLAHFRPGRWTAWFSWLLAAILLANEAGWQVVWWRGAFGFGPWSASRTLPLYLCDMAALAGAAALLWRPWVLVEITWFWAMAGTLEGIATPDHPISFFSYDWLEFYTDHIGVVLAATWLVYGLGMHPRPRAALRVSALTALFFSVVGVVDALTRGDYDYLHTNSPPGLLRLLGPWPWYILAAAGVGLLSILLVDLPFWPERGRARRDGLPAASSTTLTRVIWRVKRNS
jgi:hypothetical integral membrane protein (TIGR02206 family)